MLDGGVDINYGDVDNTTALTVAILNKQYSLAKFLVDRGIDVSIADAAGRTALYAIVDIRNEDWTALPLRKAQDSCRASKS
jgi:ankyrin repeat protein